MTFDFQWTAAVELDYMHGHIGEINFTILQILAFSGKKWLIST